jgi:DNA invertase Pin-like site-specific DNA recombinase
MNIRSMFKMAQRTLRHLVQVHMKLVSYLRVSTQKQGRSGLGLEAQLSAIEAYAAQRRGHVLRTFTEVESGKTDDRPELAKALHLAKVTGATLVIAKLDRLSRNAAFLLTLRDSGVRFVAADLPDANELTVGIMALVAQQEREAISRRTQEALAAAKRRGVRLGNPNGAAALRRAGRGNGESVAAIQTNANQHAENLRPVIADLRMAGMNSLGELAAELNARGMLTPRGGRWHRSSVRNLLARLDHVPLYGSQVLV